MMNFEIQNSIFIIHFIDLPTGGSMLHHQVHNKKGRELAIPVIEKVKM